MKKVPGLIAQTAVKKAPVNHHASVSAGCQQIANPGTFYKVEFRSSLRLVEAKRQFELPRLDLKVWKVTEIHINVAPGVVCPARLVQIVVDAPKYIPELP